MNQRNIEIAWVMGNLLSKPGWFIKAGLARFQFDLGNHQTGIFIIKDIDLPGMFALGDEMASLDDQWPDTQGLQQGMGLVQWDRVLKFGTLYINGHGLDIDICPIIINTDPDRTTVGIGKIPLDNPGLTGYSLFPFVIIEQEFSFNFNRHNCDIIAHMQDTQAPQYA